MKYRRRPVTVDAVQFMGGPRELGVCECDFTPREAIHVHTPEGPRHIDKLDWIVTSWNGERRIYKPEIFEISFEKLGDETITTGDNIDGRSIMASEVKK